MLGIQERMVVTCPTPQVGGDDKESVFEGKAMISQALNGIISWSRRCQNGVSKKVRTYIEHFKISLDMAQGKISVMSLIKDLFDHSVMTHLFNGYSIKPRGSNDKRMK